MNRHHQSPKDPLLRSLLLRGGLAFLVLLAWFFAAANGQR